MIGESNQVRSPVDASAREVGRRAAPAARIFWLLPSFGAYLFVGALLVTVVVAGQGIFARDGDVGRHIRLGLYMLRTGAIPRVDHFSHTMAGRPFVPYEWLSEVAYALAWRGAGLAGVALLAALLFALATWVLYRTTRRLGVAGPLALVFGALAFRLEALHLLPRPHLFTTLLAAVTAGLLLDFSRTGAARRLWPIPVLMLFWVNLHGGFLVGFMLLGVFLLDEAMGLIWRWRGHEGEVGLAPQHALRLRTLLAATGVSLAATLANPAGWRIWAHTLGYLRIDFLVNATQEYASPDFHSAAMLPFLAAVLLGLLLALGGRARPRRADAMLFLLWTAAALYSARNIPIFAVAAVPVLALWTQRTIEELGEGGAPEPWGSWLHRFRAWMGRMSRIDAAAARYPLFVLLGTGAAAWWALGPGRPLLTFPADRFPVAALESLGNEVPPGPVLNEFIWGGYLLLERPDIPVFIDGQTDFYGPRLTEQYLRAVNGAPGWRDVLDQYGIGWTLTATSAPLNQLLAGDPTWIRVYSDNIATVYRHILTPQ